VATGKKVVGGRVYFEGGMGSACPIGGKAGANPTCAVVVLDVALDS
jgi:hypothetical protein